MRHVASVGCLNSQENGSKMFTSEAERQYEGFWHRLGQLLTTVVGGGESTLCTWAADKKQIWKHWLYHNYVLSCAQPWSEITQPLQHSDENKVCERQRHVMNAVTCVHVCQQSNTLHEEIVVCLTIHFTHLFVQLHSQGTWIRQETENWKHTYLSFSSASQILSWKTLEDWSVYV